MADISVRGYVNDPKDFTSAKGNNYQRFRLGVTQKDKQGNKTYASFYVTHFGEAVAEKDYVEVKGRLTVETRAKDGKTFTNLNVVADSVLPPDQEAPETSRQSDAAEPEEADPFKVD